MCCGQVSIDREPSYASSRELLSWDGAVAGCMPGQDVDHELDCALYEWSSGYKTVKTAAMFYGWISVSQDLRCDGEVEGLEAENEIVGRLTLEKKLDYEPERARQEWSL